MIAALYIAIILCIVVVVSSLFGAPVVTTVSADYWSGAQTSINVSMWTDMTNNVTNMRDVTIPALRGNGTVTMNNGTTPWYNLTTSYTVIAASGTQPLTFTMPSAGTYLITANVRENTTLTAPTLTVFTEYALCDAGNTVIVANTERMGSRVQDVNNFSAVSRSFSWVYTNSTGATSVSLCGKINTAVAGRYGVASDGDGRSVLTYSKLA